jgi:hypothetical protein
MSRSGLLITNLTEKLLTYALGRGLDYHDMPTIRSITRQAADKDYRFNSLVLGIVNSPQFTMRVKSTETPASPAATAAL